jgi:hypothetical protein
VTWVRTAAGIAALTVLLAGCRSDHPQSAAADVPSVRMRVTVIRVATHPFLARYNLRLLVDGERGCRAASDLFPDTGGVSRRNLYQTATGFIVLGQFDARVVDAGACTISLSEFHALERERTFLGTFDEDAEGRWLFLPKDARSERPFETL